MYESESWTIKKAESQRIDTFEMWCWRRLFRIPWTARRSNQSILKEISPEYSLEGLMLKLKLHLIGHLMRRSDSLEKTLMLGRTEGRRRGQQRMRRLNSITDSMDRSLSKMMCLLFNMLSRLLIAFLPRSKYLLISWLQSPSTVIFGAPQNKICHCFHCFPIYLPWSDGTRCHDLCFFNVEF